MKTQVDVDGFSIIGIEARTNNTKEMGNTGVIPEQWGKFFKEGMLESSGRPLQESLAIEQRLVARVLRTKDSVEGARAFVEKRSPDFRGE